MPSIWHLMRPFRVGVALGRLALIDEDVASGRLVKAMEPAVTGATRYWLVCSPESSDWPEVACFRSRISDYIGPRRLLFV